MSASAHRAPVLAMAFAMLGVFAGSPAAHADPHDQERALRTVQAGEVLTLDQVLQRVARSQPGQVLEVQLEPTVLTEASPDTGAAPICGAGRAAAHVLPAGGAGLKRALVLANPLTLGCPSVRQG